MGKHILVIEPSHTIRKILQVHFQLVGHSVRTFATYALANEALPFFQHEPPHLAFVALHSSLPESCSLLKRTQTHYPNAALVALVLYEERTHSTIQTTLQQTRALALVKPFRIQDALALLTASHATDRSRGPGEAAGDP